LARHYVITAPASAVRPRENRRRESVDRSDTVRAFVQRTTSASNVPHFVEDPGVIEQIARVLS